MNSDPIVPDDDADALTGEQMRDASSTTDGATDGPDAADGGARMGDAAAEPDGGDASGGSDASASDASEPADATLAGGDDDAGDPGPLEDFGLSCGQALCSAVALPSQQCCTKAQDVDSGRATEAERCGVARVGVAGCYELEQPGALDPDCPTLTSTDNPLQEPMEQPGCCTAAGRCGSLNVQDGIGCYASDEIDQACGEGINEEMTCETTGVFAFKAKVDVVWGGQDTGLIAITDDGRGTIEVVLRATIDEVGDDGEFVSTVKVCGVGLPSIFNSLLCEGYTPTFPNSIWDDGSVPLLDVPGRFACNNPGCLVVFDPTTAPIGIDLDDPEAAWPSPQDALSLMCPSGRGEDCYPDHDLDGRPGVTVVMPTGGVLPGSSECDDYELSAAPLNANLFAIFGGVVRSDRLQLGVRMRLGSSGRLGEDCGMRDTVGVAEYVQSRAASCMLLPGSRNPLQTPAGPNDLCDDDERLFMDEALPYYQVLGLGQRPSEALALDDTSASQGPQFQLVRVADAGDEPSCSEVRSQF